MRIRDTKSKKLRGFTLIELLVVISIIAILAGLTLGLARVAARKMRESRTRGGLASLVTAIDTYKSELGYFPPDNGFLAGVSETDTNKYELYTSTSPLFYELSGSIYQPKNEGTFTVQNQDETINLKTIQQVFGRPTLHNAATTKEDLRFVRYAAKSTEHGVVTISNLKVEILAVPSPGPKPILGDDKRQINPWHYDASSVMRHNRNGFDLWAEILIGKQVQVIGNWKE